MVAASRDARDGACAGCGAEHPRGALVCPLCRRLVHKDELERLRERARAAAADDDAAAEVEALERMQALLPPDSPQHEVVQGRLREMGPTVRPSGSRRWGKLGLLGALILLVWKLKAIIGFALTKGKALLVGLTKAKTLLSMVVALGAYLTLWGWKFALGFVLSIYVHEMGHVIALRRLGIPASAPMFVPFVGAFVRLKQNPKTPHEDAVVGLAGPIYGLAAAVACWLAHHATDSSLLGALARAGAWINLFNLIPVWQLDGGRAFNAMSRIERWVMVVVVGAAWLVSSEGMLLLLLIGAVYRALVTRPAPAHDLRASSVYAGLVVILAALSQLPLPELARP